MKKLILQLLKEGKEKEAQEILKKELAKDLSKEEKGEILVRFAETYMSLQNDIHENYNTVLSETLKKLTQLEAEKVMEK